MDTKELLTIAERDDLTINDVLTILKFSLILDKDNNFREKHMGSSLIDLWHNIPNKKNCLAIYKEQIIRDKRRKR